MTRRKVFVMCVEILIDHWAPSCPNRYDKRHLGKGGKTTNAVIGDTDMKDVGYGIFPTILSVCHSPDWLIDTGANVHVCGDISMFSSYQTVGTSTMLMAMVQVLLFMVLGRSI